MTPVCTPSLLERRKSIAGNVEVDDEIVIKAMPDVSFEDGDEEDSDEEGLSGEEEEEEEDDQNEEAQSSHQT